MKNKLFYFIGVACLLSYTGTFTSCVNGVDDEYLEQKITDEGGSSEEGEELPDLNGDYSMVGDFDLEMTCNGDLLEGQQVTMAVDENNESATITFTAIETDLESVIGLIPGANLIEGMGLKYTGSCVIPGEKELTFTNIPLYKKGSTYVFKGSRNESTYTMNYVGEIEDEKMKIDVNYELTNPKLAGTWLLKSNLPLYPASSATMSPLWFDWDTNLHLASGDIMLPEGLGMNTLNLSAFAPNELNQVLLMAYLATEMTMDVQQMIVDLLQSITFMPNGSIYGTYAWDSDLTNPDRWSSNMNRNIVRYYYDKEKENRIYLEINGQFLLNTIKSLIQPTRTTRAAADDLRVLGTQLIELLKPVLENGIPCDYELKNNKMAINIDGEFLLNVLKILGQVGNNEAAMSFLMPLLKSDPTMAQYAPNLEIFLKRLPDLVTYHEESSGGTKSGECKYVKIGLRLDYASK